MSIADEIIWAVGDEWGMVPFDGLGDAPAHIRADILAWLKRQATTCGHSIGSPLTYRIVGVPTAWCPRCAADARLPEMVAVCTRCGTPAGRCVVFALTTAIVIGAWCDRCWRGDNSNDKN